MAEKQNERLFQLGELDDLRKALSIVEQNLKRAERTLALITEGVEKLYFDECTKMEHKGGEIT